MSEAFDWAEHPCQQVRDAWLRELGTPDDQPSYYYPLTERQYATVREGMQRLAPTLCRCGTCGGPLDITGSIVRCANTACSTVPVNGMSFSPQRETLEDWLTHMAWFFNYANGERRHITLIAYGDAALFAKNETTGETWHRVPPETMLVLDTPDVQLIADEIRALAVRVSPIAQQDPELVARLQVLAHAFGNVVCGLPLWERLEDKKPQPAPVKRARH